MTINLGWKWKTAIAVFMLYSAIARYCAFKLAIGLATANCGCS